MADLIYNNAPKYLGDGTIDLDNDTLKCILLTDSHTPDATDDVYADVSADEVAAGSGYSTGGVALANVSYNQSGGITTLDADDPYWTTATFTGRYAVIYDDTPSSPADPLICLLDFLANKTGLGGNFYVNFHADGIMQAQQGS